MLNIKPSTTPPNFPELEEQVEQYWQNSHAFQKSIDMRSADKSYVFYDGPPFATGMPHYGHLLASTIKDVIPRFWTMKGWRVERRWGWDCHGLPIENMIEKELGIKGGKKGIEEMGIAQFNAACRAEVLRLDKEWEKVIGRLGRWVDMTNNYKTMDTSFMESVWWGFQQLFDKNMVYEGKKVILYCSRCATPLSNFEIAMDNSYVEVNEPSTTYKYQITNTTNTFLLAWSTTPWNKVATPALAVNGQMEYVKVKQNNEFYILAATRLSMLGSDPYEIVETYTGQDLTKLNFIPHFDFYPNRTANEKFGVIIADDFVTDADGTGVVTLAIYGEDDYRVMLENNIQLIEHVDAQGKFKAEVTPWAGMYILKANAAIDAELEQRNLIYSHTPHQHSLPTCYRCGTRLYYAPLPAWFIDVKQIRNDLITANENINWYPKHLKHGRFLKGLEGAPDWNISRSRYWGTPMPIWRATQNNKTHTRVIGSIAQLQEWAVDPKQAAQITDIHREFIDDIEVWVDDNRTIAGKRIPEVFDCWVESGSMPFASQHYPFANQQQFEDNSSAQFVSEYIAQTRAWFYTMHVMSVGIFGQAPFENVLTTGTILAADGTKMSKSKKNYPDPMGVINTYGVDSLRLYLMSSTVMKGENLNFNEKEIGDIRRKVFVVWWNVLMFYLSFKPATTTILRPSKLPEHALDKWLLSKLDNLTLQVTNHLDNYDVVHSSRLLMEFVAELSTWYLRLSRDRLRSQPSSSAWQVFGYCLHTLAQLFAPFAPFITEVMHQTLVDDNSSVHHTNWPALDIDTSFVNQQLELEMALTQQITEKGHAARKDSGIKVRQPLQSVTITASQPQFVVDIDTLLQQELNVKQVIWLASSETNLTVTLDTNLTPELVLEGEARELARQIQQQRKKLHLKPQDVVKVTAPTIPTGWEQFIKDKTNATELLLGTELTITLVTG